MTDIINTTLTIQDITEALRTRAPLIFSRFGDSEWISALNVEGISNCDGHPFFPAMGDEIRQMLATRPPYILGMQSLAMRMFGPKIKALLGTLKLLDLKWTDADVLHRALQSRELAPFITALRERPLRVFIGPEHLLALDSIFPQSDANRSIHITVDSHSAYLGWRDVARACEPLLAEPDVVFTVSSGPSSVLLIDRLARLGAQTVLDVGSLWDPFCGVMSRNYMRRGVDLGAALGKESPQE